MNSTTLNRIEPATTPKPHFLDGLAARAVQLGWLDWRTDR